MQFKEPRVSIQDQGDKRLVTVALPVEGSLSEHVLASFYDPEQPNEDNASERARLIAKAKGLFAQAAS